MYVSSYAAASPDWNRAEEEALFAGLERLGVTGLELPFYGTLHAHDDAWLISQLRPSWRFIISPLPGVMRRLGADPQFGIASPDEDGRRRALDFLEEARRTIEHLNRYLGRRAVAAVNLHTAPRSPSPDALLRSLEELRARDWQGAELLIEHCDAAVPGRPFDKGFMALEDELRTGAGVLLNWGRSAVETRSARGPLEHIALAKGALRGLFFSGAIPSHPEYGEWRDSHVPFSTSCPGSLLTPQAARDAVAAAAPVSYLGIKIQPLPRTLATPERLAMIKAAIDALS